MWVTITLSALYSKKEDDGTSRMFHRPPRLGVYGDDQGCQRFCPSLASMKKELSVDGIVECEQTPTILMVRFDVLLK